MRQLECMKTAAGCMLRLVTGLVLAGGEVLCCISRIPHAGCQKCKTDAGTTAATCPDEVHDHPIESGHWAETFLLCQADTCAWKQAHAVCALRAWGALVSCSVDCGPPPLAKNTGALMETALFIAAAMTSLTSPWLSFWRLVACAVH